MEKRAQKRMRQARLSFHGGISNDDAKRARRNPVVSCWKDFEESVLAYESPGWYSGFNEKLGKSKLPVAAFDLDGTLIKQASGLKFPKAPDDFALWHCNVVPKLKECVAAGKVVVVFTNQAGIKSAKRIGIEGFRERVEGIARMIDVPFALYCALERNRYRKPCIGMWDLFVHRMMGVSNIDLDCSVFVGDAFGREGDFADTDYKFALNTSLQPWTPEVYFLGKSQEDERVMVKQCFHPRSYITTNDYQVGEPANLAQVVHLLKQIVEPADVVEKLAAGFSAGDKNEPKVACFVMLQGGPATGKTTFAKRYLEGNGYAWVNLDVLGTNSKCVKAVKEALRAGKSVVVDNTHGPKSSRARYLTLANEYTAEHGTAMPKICLRMDTEKELALHMNALREIATNGNLRRLPPVAFNTYYKREMVAKTDEGFDAVARVRFRAHFTDDHEKAMFTRYT